MIVLDTTVLVYAIGTEHPLREPCARLLKAIRAGRVAATTTPEVVQEFVHVRSRRRSRGDAALAGRDYATVLGPLLPVTDEALERGLDLFERHDALDCFDAVLAAAALEYRAAALVSADRGFAAVASLPFVDPATPEFERLLG